MNRYYQPKLCGKTQTIHLNTLNISVPYENEKHTVFYFCTDFTYGILFIYEKSVYQQREIAEKPPRAGKVTSLLKKIAFL